MGFWRLMSEGYGELVGGVDHDHWIARSVRWAGGEERLTIAVGWRDIAKLGRDCEVGN